MSLARTAVAARIVVAIFGGYILSSSLVALLSVGLPWMIGQSRSEAVLLASILGFLIYLTLGLWAFAHRSLLRVSLLFGFSTVAAYCLMAIIRRSGG